MFVHLLPEITARQAEMAGGESATGVAAAGGELSLFIVALAGFALFYALERLAARSRRETDGDEVLGDAETRTPASVFWIHLGSFSAYNGLVGYLLLHREETGLLNLLFYFTAMALHFVVNDYGLHEHHREAYTRVGRWLLAGSVLLGFLVGSLVAVPEVLPSLLLAFLAGGVILNVIKEELPEERQSRFWAFAAGLVGYTAVLLAV
ncbi:hypothetical protein [Halopelagius fulvigenes]|uniref:ZIP Zinc transporter n=1 Tax=Halopelagius fulvigenes TaxID=1198324 RepID=A0ABD5U0L6_9EURY